jgi:hypothetical protein
VTYSGPDAGTAWRLERWTPEAPRGGEPHWGDGSITRLASTDRGRGRLLAVSADGSLLVLGDDGAPLTLRRAPRYDPERLGGDAMTITATAAALSPDGNRLVTATLTVAWSCGTCAPADSSRRRAHRDFDHRARQATLTPGEGTTSCSGREMESQRSGARAGEIDSGRRVRRSGGLLLGGLVAGLVCGCAEPLRQVQVVYDVTPGSASLDCGGKPRSVCVRVDGVAEGNDWNHFVRGGADVSVWAVNRNLFCSTEAPQISAKAFAPPSPFTGQPAKLVLDTTKAAGLVPLTPLKNKDIDEDLEALVKILTDIIANLNGDENDVATIWLDCLKAPPFDRLRDQKNHAGTLRTHFIDQNQAWADSLKAFNEILKRVSGQIERMPTATAPEKDKKKAAADELDKIKADRADLDKAIAKTRGDVAPVLAVLSQIEAEEARATPDAERPYAGATLLDEQSFDVNQTVTVEVQQQILPTVTTGADGKQRSLGKTAFNTLSPIRLDVGIGPAWIMSNAESWAVSAAPGAAVGTVTRSEQLNMDGIVTFSWYYRPRYLDGTLFSWDWHVPTQWVPRPLVGLSLRSPFTSIYAGLQIEPVRFIDVSFGAYVYSRAEAVGVTEGEIVPTGMIATRSHLTASPFLSISSSINLFVGWFSSLVK